MDFEKDKEENRTDKSLVTGDIKKESSISLIFIFLTLGLIFSIFLNKIFVAIIVLMLLLNFFYSSNFFRLKENIYYGTIIMSFTQFLKYASGWFLMSQNISSFPFFLILCFTGVYMLVYLYYREKFKINVPFKGKILLGAVLI